MHVRQNVDLWSQSIFSHTHADYQNSFTAGVTIAVFRKQQKQPLGIWTLTHGCPEVWCVGDKTVTNSNRKWQCTGTHSSYFEKHFSFKKKKNKQFLSFSYKIFIYFLQRKMKENVMKIFFTVMYRTNTHKNLSNVVIVLVMIFLQTPLQNCELLISCLCNEASSTSTMIISKWHIYIAREKPSAYEKLLSWLI